MVRRALALLLLVGCSGKGERGAHYVERTTGPIQIDGIDNEKDWGRARSSAPFVAAVGGPEVHGEARARLLWDDQNLYVFVNVKDRDVKSKYEMRDDPLWNADCIELFIDADGSRNGYVELQVNPLNTHFDAWFPQTRAQPHSFKWNGKYVSSVAVDGTANKHDDKDNGWNVEMAIPFTDVRGGDPAMKIDIPPKPRTTWRINAVRIDANEGDKMRFSSWTPIPIQDFHAIDRLMTITFVNSVNDL